MEKESLNRVDVFVDVIRLFPSMRSIVFNAFDAEENRVTRTQQAIMFALYTEGTMNMSALSRIISTSNEQATRAVAQLVDRGFVVREHDENNGRVILVSLTTDAEEYMEDILDCAADDLDDRIGKLTDRELKKLNEGLKILNKIQNM